MSMLQRASMLSRGCLMRLRSRRDGSLQRATERKDTRDAGKRRHGGLVFLRLGWSFHGCILGGVTLLSLLAFFEAEGTRPAFLLHILSVPCKDAWAVIRYGWFCPNEQHKNHNYQTHRSISDCTKLSSEFKTDMADLAACLQSTSTAYGHQHYLTDFNCSSLVSTSKLFSDFLYSCSSVKISLCPDLT